MYCILYTSTCVSHLNFLLKIRGCSTIFAQSWEKIYIELIEGKKLIESVIPSKNKKYSSPSGT